MKTKYEKMIVVKSKEQASSIVNNLRGNGVKAYYEFAWVVKVEVRE